MKVSVALITYNGERYLEEQLRSILKQSVLPTQVVLRDDQSSDRTVELARRILTDAPFQVDIAVNPERRGVVGNMEAALQACTGDVVATCDQDDVWYPERLEVLLATLQDPHVAGVFSNADIIDGHGRRTGESLWARLHGIKDWRDEDEARRHLAHGNIVTGATLAVRSSIARLAVPFPSACYHDHWLALLACGTGRLVAVPQPLLAYRLHEGNVAGLKKQTPWERFTHRLRVAGFPQAQADLLGEALARMRTTTEPPPMLPAIHAYLVRRTQLPPQRIRRLPDVARLLLRGNYTQFGRGARTLAADIFLPESRRHVSETELGAWGPN